MHKKIYLLAGVCSMFSTGCVTTGSGGSNIFTDTFASSDPCSNNARNIGIAVGAVAGAVIGNQVKHSNTSRLLGAAAGAAVGGLIGADMDRRRCELHRIAQKNNLDMQVEDVVASRANGSSSSASDGTKSEVVGMKVAIRDNGTQFQSGSDVLTPEAVAYFSAIADQYSYAQQKKRLNNQSGKDDIAAVEQLKSKQIFLVGHTDDTGNSTLNAELSERRARAVARIFRDRGIADSQIFYQGAGETLPIADNRTEDGRSKNRRVEIVDTSDQATFTQYLESRKPNVAFYRPSSVSPSSSMVAAKAPAKLPAKLSTKAKPVTAAKEEAVSTSAPPAPTGLAAAQMAITAKPEKRQGQDMRSMPESSSSPQTAAMAAAAVQSKPAAATTAGGLDFGGAPAQGRFVVPDIGGMQQTSSSFSIVSSAYADESMPLSSCAQDRPRVAMGVKSLSSGREQKFSTADYLPGVYDSSWSGALNGHLVALTHVAVLRDGGAPARQPTLLIYSNYTGNKSAEPVYRGTPEVNVYRGRSALLYRVFANGPTQCMDIVIPNDNPKTAPNSNLVYKKSGTLYQVAFSPSLVR